MTESRPVVAWVGGGGWKRGSTRDMSILLCVTDVFTILIMVMVSRVFTYVTSHQIIPTKYVQFIVSQLYHSKSAKNKTNKTTEWRALGYASEKTIKFPNKNGLKNQSSKNLNYKILSIWSANRMIQIFFSLLTYQHSLKQKHVDDKLEIFFVFKLFLTFVQWWWTSIVPSITWPTALIPDRSVNIIVHPGDKTQTFGHCPERLHSFSTVQIIL